MPVKIFKMLINIRHILVYLISITNHAIKSTPIPDQSSIEYNANPISDVLSESESNFRNIVRTRRVQTLEELPEIAIQTSQIGPQEFTELKKQLQLPQLSEAYYQTAGGQRWSNVFDPGEVCKDCSSNEEMQVSVPDLDSEYLELSSGEEDYVVPFSLNIAGFISFLDDGPDGT